MAETREPALPQSRPPLRLLIVDDDEVSREVLTLMAEGEGYHVVALDCGDEALRWVAGNGISTPHIILTDLQMPGTTGAPLAHALRAACGPEPRLFAMSGSMPVRHDDAFLAPFDGFLKKPFTMDQLAEALAGIEPSPGGDPAESASMLDRATYDLLEQSMGAQQLAKLFDLCLSDAGRRIETMREAIAHHDVDTYRKAAHAIKGGCGLVGATELYRIATDLEQNGIDDVSLDSLDVFLDASARLQRMLSGQAPSR